MPNLDIALLGPWQMHLAGQPVTHFPTTKVQALLAYLAVEAQSAHTRDALLGLFWAEYSADSARQNLRKTLQRLRQLLPAAYLLANSQTLQFNPASDYHLDVAAFTRLVAPCRHQPPADQLACSTCIDQLQQAVALYRGDFLAHFFVEDSPAFEEWVLLKREWLRREALGALHQLAAYHQQQEAYDRAYPYAWRQVELDPVREEAHQQLMVILALRGQRSEALAQYETCRHILADELDVEPAQETSRLYEQIRAGQFDRTTPPASVTLPSRSLSNSPPTNLPAALTTCVGRDWEVAEVRHLLASTRLITLTGVGGTGKTRLALEIAAQVAQAASFRDGVWWVELAPLSDPTLIPQTIATSFGLREQPGQALERTLADYLRPRHLLLLLDNCEHLVAGCAQFAHQWLENSPSLHILATSREPLQLRGEQRFPVAPLAADPACQLFVQCAHRIDPACDLTSASAAIAELCQQLDYLPLAIELLAARIDRFSPQAMLIHLQASRLDLLRGDARDLPTRQQTVRNAIQHSYDLLADNEQALFRTLGVFVGGFDLAAVAHFGFGEDTVQSLLQKSLVRPAPSEQGERRFFLLETLREYAHEQLSQRGELAQQQQRHATYFTSLAKTAEPGLFGSDQDRWAQQLESEMGNLRAALTWWQTTDVEQALQLANALWFLWFMRDYLQEGRQWLQRLGHGSEGTLRSRAKAAVRAAACAKFQGDFTGRDTLAAAAIPLARTAGDPLVLGHVLILLGNAAYRQADYVRERDLYAEALQFIREAESPPGYFTAIACQSLGEWAIDRRELDQAAAWLEHSLRLHQQSGNRWMTQYIYYDLGILEHSRGNLDRAIAHFETGLELTQKAGNKNNTTLAMCDLAWMLLEQGKQQEAALLLTKSLKLGSDLVNKQNKAVARIGLATIARHQKQYAQVEAILAESLTCAEQGNQRVGSTLIRQTLAYLAILQGEYGQAAALYQACIAEWQAVTKPLWIASALRGFAILAIAHSQPERALRLSGAEAALRQAHGPALGFNADLQWSPDEQRHWEQTIDIASNQLDEANAAHIWVEGQTMTLNEAVAYALLTT